MTVQYQMYSGGNSAVLAGSQSGNLGLSISDTFTLNRTLPRPKNQLFLNLGKWLPSPSWLSHPQVRGLWPEIWPRKQRVSDRPTNTQTHKHTHTK